jgi:hypothetical protein
LGFFPLDEQLGLRPNHAYTPRLAESMTRLATWMPFQRAATELAFFSGVPVAEATVRRITQAAGAAYVAVQEAVVEALEREAPEGQPGPALQLLSVDGAFIQLINREWKEVKTLALGEVQPPVLEQGKPVVHTRALSSFSRCSASETFVRQALVETHRRGVTEAGVVCAVTDGSVWIQGFIDYHRPDAVRILDQPQALEYVATIGKALYGDDTSAFTAWYARQQQRLSTEAPEGVLAEMRAAAGPEPSEVVEDSLTYLTKRCRQVQYAEFLARGYPIGDGSVESANKLVVEARLKGTGMRWEEGHVDKMLALRNIACNDRWREGWAQLEAEQQAASRRKRVARGVQKAMLWRANELLAVVPARREVQPMVAASPDVPRPVPMAVDALAAKRPCRPAADHPWRRPFRRRAQG